VKTQTLHIESRTERLIAVREFVSDAARDFGFTEEEIGKIALAVDEACTNVIKHAYKYDPSKRISITIRVKNGAFQVAIRDTGGQFNPDGIRPPDLKNYLTHPHRGGLGVHLMRSLMDKVEYEVMPESNEVRLTKFLPR
jgi:serine/threonine-protein kinase RsbW